MRYINDRQSNFTGCCNRRVSSCLVASLNSRAVFDLIALQQRRPAYLPSRDRADPDYPPRCVLLQLTFCPRNASGAISVLKEEKSKEEEGRKVQRKRSGRLSLLNERVKRGIHVRGGRIRRISIRLCADDGVQHRVRVCMRVRGCTFTSARARTRSNEVAGRCALLSYADSDDSSRQRGGGGWRLGRRVIIIKVTRAHNHSNGRRRRPTGRLPPRRGQKRKRISNPTQPSAVTLECANSR